MQPLPPPPSRPVTRLPPNYHEVQVGHLVLLVASMMYQLIAVNDRIPWEREQLTRFHSRVIPGISVLDYLERLARYTSMENSCLLMLLVYIDRASHYGPTTTNSGRDRPSSPPEPTDSSAAVRSVYPTNFSSFHQPRPVFHISSLTIHRFLITATTVAAKAVCDFYCTNSHYARVGGISIQELNSLEVELLKNLRWEVTATFETLQQYYINLVRRHPQFEIEQHLPYPMSPTHHISGNGISPTANASSCSSSRATTPSRLPNASAPSSVHSSPRPAVSPSPLVNNGATVTADDGSVVTVTCSLPKTNQCGSHTDSDRMGNGAAL
ncbi:Pho80p cyclin [Dispira simplex]|nr:Pho80p cyclin [Dispira simplex]